MTDNEIKKALKCCHKAMCSECSYEINCIKYLTSDALDLINRKEELIESLIAGQETLQKALAEKNAEIERLKKVQVQYVEAWIDEFVERLKNDCLLAVSNTGLLNIVIDELVESMKSDFSRLEDFSDLIKAEAIKEFAKAYKDQIKNYTGMFTDEGFYVPLDAVLSAVDFVLNKTLEEMVGVQDV